MDREQFDAFTRLVSTTLSRRLTIMTALGAALFGIDDESGLAKKRRKNKKRKNKKRRKNKKKRNSNTQQAINEPTSCYPGTRCDPGSGRNTSQCDFSGATIFNGRAFGGANLSHSNFSGADMRGANFEGANLSDSCFAGADLLDASLDDAVNFHGSIFCGTRMPDGSTNDSGCAQGTACCPTSPPDDTCDTTISYVQEFYPLWFTYYQFRTQSVLGKPNELVGPRRITPVYQAVVAINVDTLYASSGLDLTEQPVIVTIPTTPVRYSILTLDPYGTIYDVGLVGDQPGTFGLVGPGYSGSLPPGVTRIAMPFNYMVLIFRADTHSATNQDLTAEAEQFRANLQLQPLCDYLDVICPDGSQPDTSGGFTSIVPVEVFAEPFKTVADDLVARNPLEFLKLLQTAVQAPNTPPMSANVQALSDRFDQLFGNGSQNQQVFAQCTQDAHAEILNNYLSNRGPTNWIHFTNIGAWGDNVIDRSSITEFIQYGNGSDTAAYYHTFLDGDGRPLEGANDRVYVMTFPAEDIPEASRFWSVTAYTPQAIELIPNLIDKYAVARYTPNLETNPDGSISIYMSELKPIGVPEANWLPVHRRQFNVMLRVYGPEGSVANNTYVPPAIEEYQ